jgi:hypothetical protein
MSWLRNHLRHFVLPGIHTLRRTDRRNLTVHDIVPRERQIRPSTKCKYVEAGMLYSLVASVLKKGDPTREIALGLCRQIGRAKDAEFVYAIDARGGVKNLGNNYDGVEGSDVLHSMLCNSMRRLKRKMRRKGSLLLPGRDVWCWEVMAQKLSVASTFDARVSRGVAYNEKALRVCIDDWKVKTWDDVLFFDTGFAGSIPKAIARAEGLDEINMLLLSSHDTSKQIFRTHTGSRAKALAFEYLAKYFVSGTSRENKPYQELNPLDDFIKAALLTIWLWYHVSPTRLPSYRDKKLKRADPKLMSKYSTTKINPAYSGTGFLTGTTATTPFQITTDSNAATITSNWDTSITTNGIWANDTGTGTIINQLWNAGPSGQIVIDNSSPPPQMEEHLANQMQLEMDKGVIGKLLKDAGGNPDKIPTDKIPPNMLYEPVGAILNPDTFTPHDPKTGVNLEIMEDVKALHALGGDQEALKDLESTFGIKPLEALASTAPEDGFNLGQYPGPPVVNGQMLKTLAGSAPGDAPPQINLSIEQENGVFVKKTVFTTPIAPHLQPKGKSI